MSKILINGLLSFVFGAAVLTASVTDASGQDVIRKILKRMDLHNKNLVSLKADVTMVKYDSVLKMSDTYTGDTSYLPKTRKQKLYMRLNWLKPVEEHLIVIGDRYELYNPKRNQLFEGNVTQAQKKPNVNGPLGIMRMSAKEISAKYEAEFLGEEKTSSGVMTGRLRLTPKGKESYKSAELWIDVDGMPIQGRVTERNDDTTTVTLSGINKNATLNAAAFTMKYPKNVSRPRT
jgi:outer membrane lipoprotein-sorting protein